MTSASSTPTASNVRRRVFSACLIVSALLMIVGHYAVMTSGAWFDPVSGEKYNLLRRWVSDFAAKWPEGLWIKTSIVFFCAAVIVWCRSTKTSTQLTGKEVLTSFLRWSLASLIVIGLALVIIYDMSPPQYRDGELSLIAKLWGEAPKKVPAIKDPIVWTIEGHHNAGFRLFVSGFLALVLMEMARSWKRRDLGTLASDGYILLFSVAFTIWLVAMKESLAGVPQRGLLILLFVWLWNRRKDLTFAQGHEPGEI